MGIQYRITDHGCCFRSVPRCIGDRYGDNGGILPFYHKSIRCDEVHGMGDPFPHYCMAALPCVWRADYRGRESVAIGGARRSVRPADWVCKADFYIGARYCQSPIHSAYGSEHDGRGLHLCGNRAGLEQWPADDRINRYDRRPYIGFDPADCTRLELFQAAAGGSRTVYRGRCVVLHLPTGILHGRLQSHQSGFQELVPDGRIAAPAAGHERLVYPQLQFISGPVYRKWRCVKLGTGLYLPVAVLRTGISQDRPEV